MQDVASDITIRPFPDQSPLVVNHLQKFHIDNGLLKFNSRIVFSPNSAWKTKIFQAHPKNLSKANKEFLLARDEI